jgi:hypothetical protein
MENQLRNLHVNFTRWYGKEEVKPGGARIVDPFVKVIMKLAASIPNPVPQSFVKKPSVSILCWLHFG